MATQALLRAATTQRIRPTTLHRHLSNNGGASRLLKSHQQHHASASLRSASAALFSTHAKDSSNDNFLSGASSLYAESMLEMYENDPDSVPEVSVRCSFLWPRCCEIRLAILFLD